MSDVRSAVPRRGGLAVWLFIALAVTAVAAVGTAIALFDIRRDVHARRDEQLSRLISHAERSAAHIASQLLEDGKPNQLHAVKSARWLRTYWTQTLSRQPYRLYAAVIALDGAVIAHTNRDQEGRRLSRRARHIRPALGRAGGADRRRADQWRAGDRCARADQTGRPDDWRLSRRARCRLARRTDE